MWWCWCWWWSHHCLAASDKAQQAPPLGGELITPCSIELPAVGSLVHVGESWVGAGVANVLAVGKEWVCSQGLEVNLLQGVRVLLGNTLHHHLHGHLGLNRGLGPLVVTSVSHCVNERGRRGAREETGGGSIGGLVASERLVLLVLFRFSRVRFVKTGQQIDVKLRNLPNFRCKISKARRVFAVLCLFVDISRAHTHAPGRSCVLLLTTRVFVSLSPECRSCVCCAVHITLCFTVSDSSLQPSLHPSPHTTASAAAASLCQSPCCEHWLAWGTSAHVYTILQGPHVGGRANVHLLTFC